MSRRSETFAWLTRDPGRGLLLVTGRGIAPILASAGWVDRATWSASGRGWVLPLPELDDLSAELELARIPYKIKERV